MPLFSYRALDAAGKSSKGTVQAASPKEAQEILRERKIYPLSIRNSQHFRLSLSSTLRLGQSVRLNAKELASFTRQIATLLEATIPYDAALGMIQQETSNEALKTVVADVRDRVVEGAYLADAFGAHPKVFPPLVINMVRSGEASGTLVMILQRLADYYDNSNRLRSKITSAMIYPAFMLVFISGVVGFMITYIIPEISALYRGFGKELPLPTRILIGISDAIINYWWLWPMLIGGVGYALYRFMQTEKGQEMKDNLELSFPIWNRFRKKLILQRMAETLGTMLSSGVELKDALAVTRGVMENRVYLKAMERVIFDVQNKGMALSTAFRNAGVFPEDVCQMVAIGEETATLDAMLENVSRRLGYEVSATLEAATALFEPIMIVLLGAITGFVVISILLPMLQQNQLLG